MTERYPKTAQGSPAAMGSQEGLLDQFILFGDSITQQACSQELGFAFQPALQNAFIRRLDVINRGFSGYNTSQCLAVLPSFMPKPSQAHVRFMTIFLGANDACLPGTSGQDVPLARYHANLKRIIQHPTVRAHSEASADSRKPATKIILITPPPVDEHQLEANGGSRNRTAEWTKSYADACLKAGEELHVAVVDLWGVMMKKAGWEGQEGEVLVGSKERERSEVLGELLKDGKSSEIRYELVHFPKSPCTVDLLGLLRRLLARPLGLHFNPMGYKVLFDATMQLIQDKWPSEDPDGANYHYVLPVWERAPRAD